MVRILHVDDEAEFGAVASAMLEREDDRFDVVSEESPAAGLERLQAESIDCIVSDYQMPETDGLEFLQAVRDEHPQLPFILFTGQGSEEIASDAISAGATDYIQKGGGTDQYVVLANRISNAVERYRALRDIELSHRAMETAKEGISLVRGDGTFSYVNPVFAELFEYDRHELLGKHWKTIYHQQTAERLENDILPAVRETGYWAGETVRLTRSGKRLVTDHRLARTEEDVIVCTARDLTEQRANQATRWSEFDLLVDAMSDFAFYTLDHEGYVTRWNGGAARLLGYEPEEVLGAHVGVFFTEDDRRAGLPTELIETAKAEGSVTDEGRRVNADGSQIRATLTISASYDDNGTLRGFGTVLEESREELIA